MIQLDFVIIGAEKSGTTLLVDRLRRSPHVTMPVNEVRYFRDPFFPKRERLDLYFSEGDADKLKGIKHPSYLGRPEVPTRIKSHSPDAKLIAILRDPAERAVASYLHYLRHGQIPCIHPNVGIPIMLDDPEASPKYRDILAFGDYARYLGLYLENFAREQMLVLEFEAFTHSQDGLQSLFDFLGLAVPAGTWPLKTVNGGTYDWGICRRQNAEAWQKFIFDDARNIIGSTGECVRNAVTDEAPEPLAINEDVMTLLKTRYANQVPDLRAMGLLDPQYWHASPAPSHYYNADAIDTAVANGEHRSLIGGMWDEIGQLQLDFLIAQGLQPRHRLLDIGCGSLRGGVKFVRYLDPNNYFGTDLNEPLLRAGYEIEVAREGLADKLPKSHLIADGTFDFSWCVKPFDFALAQSVFTHLPATFLRTCLERLHTAMVESGRFYVTFFEIPDGHPDSQPHKHQHGGITHAARDPYHHRFSDLSDCCNGLPWKAEYIGAWGHPRSQYMACFIKT